MLIKNYEELASHGNTKGRRVVLDVLEAGLAAGDPYDNVRKMLRVENGQLFIGHKDFAARGTEKVPLPLVFDVSKIGGVYVFGGGKAVQRVAQAIEDALGDLVVDGQVNVKKGEPKRCRRINVTFAGHPLPDEDGVRGAIRKHEVEKRVKAGDIVFYLTSGGGTATLAWPAPGLILKDVQDMTRLIYFEKGASMPEKNLVVGKLRMPSTGEVTYGVPLIHIASSETPPGDRDDHHRRFPSTDAIDILKRYGAWEETPPHIRAHLEKVRDDPRYYARGVGVQTEFTYDEVYSFRVIGPEYMLEAARKRAEDLGVHAHILCSSINDIETRPIAETLAKVASEVARHGRPFEPPCVLLLGGEPTVSTGKATGRGGRNQEFALAAAPWITGSRSIVFGAADSDGSDGPTDVDGGLADGYTLERAEQSGLDLYAELDNHNSYEALTRLNDTIYTGQLGQNLRSLFVVYVGKP